MVRSTSLAIEIAHAHGLLRHGYFLLMVMILLRADAVPGYCRALSITEVL
jgi:hypothetical protein